MFQTSLMIEIETSQKDCMFLAMCVGVCPYYSVHSRVPNGLVMRFQCMRFRPILLGLRVWSKILGYPSIVDIITIIYLYIYIHTRLLIDKYTRLLVEKYSRWLGTLIFYDFPYFGNVIIPTDELICFR